VAYVVEWSNPLVIAERRDIAASAQEIFSILRDPKRHHEFDGSTMLRHSDYPPIDGVGQSFVMRMHNEDFGAYEMRNEIVEFELDRAIAWAPKRHDVIDDEDWDHRWGWRLSPEGRETEVTAYFDCTRVPDEGRRILDQGEWARPILVRSLQRLEHLVVT